MGKGSVTTNKRLADCRKKDQFESQQSITVFAVIAITRQKTYASIFMLSLFKQHQSRGARSLVFGV